MKYNISFEIQGEAKAYLEHLRAIVSEAFDVHRALLRAPPPHLTLKYSFHATPEQLVKKTS
ncbi:hypothetical protein K9M74_00350 [Candidatus Woesearchaeota archaeon]|nr:hypothetical protein [Candidatus Woesearchaeota archaeon]